MAYQNVGKPRFYIDYFSYWQSMGLVHALKSWNWNGNYHDGYFIGLNPSSNTTLSTGDVLNAEAPEDKFVIAVDLKEAVPSRVLDSINFCGVLGHNINVYSDEVNGCEIKFITNQRDAMDSQIGQHTQMGSIIPHDGISDTESDIEIINAEKDSTELKVANSGFSLSKVGFQESSEFIENEIDRFSFRIQWRDPSGYIIGGENSDEVISGSWNLNCLTMGHFYDMPVSPDLDVKMEVEFDGYDTAETLGGSTLSNLRYTRNPKWGNNNAWEIGESNPHYKRNGRRSWSMKFSFISDKDIFSSNYSSNNWLSNTTDNSDYNSNDDLTSDENNFEYTLADDDSFIAKVLNFVGNGQRFIFQPDNTNNNPDQFAICVLDQDSLSIGQKAFKAYNISLKIKEVW